MDNKRNNQVVTPRLAANSGDVIPIPGQSHETEIYGVESQIASQAVDLSAAIDAVNDLESLDEALSHASTILAARHVTDDKYAHDLGRLIAVTKTYLASQAFSQGSSHLAVPFDDRFAQCFEQMLSLIYQQDLQIAELRQIVSDLI